LVSGIYLIRSRSSGLYAELKWDKTGPDYVVEVGLSPLDPARQRDQQWRLHKGKDKSGSFRIWGIGSGAPITVVDPSAKAARPLVCKLPLAKSEIRSRLVCISNPAPPDGFSLTMNERSKAASVVPDPKRPGQSKAILEPVKQNDPRQQFELILLKAVNGSGDSR
jgi:hypothetical protein